MIIKILKKKNGFTLIEMVVYVGVGTIVLASVIAMAIWTIRIGAKAKADRELIHNAARAMETMIFEIKKSQSLYDPTCAFETNPGQISLEQKNSSLPDETSAFVDFFQCQEALCVKRESAAAAAITNNQVVLTNLTFEKMENSTTSPSVRIILEMESKSSVWGISGPQSGIKLINSAKINE
ncbi:MAG: hypothetical protein UV40_C0038G0004 [Parcubacteria group bacterium GW2011_GWA1_42_7]|nr:MAG: hypothetical protein UV40_C0038G0004 [Parcubacteria group bacterium GW2011_GWA1_42_7]KKS91310.1 MAG: hypothetical protein UV67_C0032G0016 [Parcubacteria group bacterium GW2011_GWC1_43_12]